MLFPPKFGKRRRFSSLILEVLLSDCLAMLDPNFSLCFNFEVESSAESEECNNKTQLTNQKVYAFVEEQRKSHMSHCVGLCFSMAWYKIVKGSCSCVYLENTSDKWDIPWYTTRKRCITSRRKTEAISI